jgi:hypothetical protein
MVRAMIHLSIRSLNIGSVASLALLASSATAQIGPGALLVREGEDTFVERT